jgi:hypothetical protein
MTETLVTERLILRPPVPDDWPAWHAFYTSPRSKFVGGPCPESDSALCHSDCAAHQRTRIDCNSTLGRRSRMWNA